MALELRPSCEHCDKSLPPSSQEAMICSYECTFCRECVNQLLLNVCPNCGGGFSPRPHRPMINLKGNNFLGADPASIRKVHKPVAILEHADFAKAIKDIEPHER